MLEFVAEGQWLAGVPAPLDAEDLAIGLVIFPSCLDLIDLPQPRNVNVYPNGVPVVAIVPALPGLRKVHVAGLVWPKTLQAIARRLFPPVAIRSSSGLA